MPFPCWGPHRDVQSAKARSGDRLTSFLSLINPLKKCRKRLHLAMNGPRNFDLLLRVERVAFMHFVHYAVMIWILMGQERFQLNCVLPLRNVKLTIIVQVCQHRYIFFSITSYTIKKRWYFIMFINGPTVP